MPTSQQIYNMLISLRCSDLLVEDVHSMSNGSVRLCTVLKYPDGSQIDLFLYSNGPSNDSEIFVTDYATTISWLGDAGIELSSSQIEHFAKIYKVKFLDGVFVVQSRAENLLTDLLNVGQVCILISGSLAGKHSLHAAEGINLITQMNLPLASASRILADFEPDLRFATVDARSLVRDRLFEIGIPFVQSPVIARIDGSPIDVDFLLKTEKLSYALMVIRQSPRRKVAERWADGVFATFYDLRESQWKGDYISAFDDVSEKQTLDITDRPIKRLSEISKVIPVSEATNRLPMLMQHQ